MTAIDISTNHPPELVPRLSAEGNSGIGPQLHIVHVIDDFRVAGTSQFICDLSEFLIAHGHRVTLATVRTREHCHSWLLDKISGMGVEVVDFGWSSNRRFDFVDFAFAVRRGRKLLRSLRPDVIQLHTYFAEQAVHLAYPFSSLPIVTTIATDSPSFDSQKLRHKLHDGLSMRLYAKSSTHIVTRSRFLENRIRARMQLGNKHVDCIWNGLSPKWFEESTNAPRDIDVVVSGRMDANKNQATIVRALAKLRDSGRSVRAVLAGDGPCMRQVQAEIERLRLTDSVSCPGFVDDPKGLFERAKVVACPSFYEGFSRTPIEGLARGCACICSDIPSHREILSNGRFGVLTDPGDPTAWAENIARLLDDQGFREASIRVGQKWVQENFAFEQLARKYLKLYEQVHAKWGGTFRNE